MGGASGSMKERPARAVPAASAPPADAVPPLVHGGRRLWAERTYPEAPRPFLDLSTGINPQAYPLPALAPESFTRLPEPEAQASLETVAAAAYGVADPAMVVAAPGTQILIGLLSRLFPQDDIAVLSPTYHEHARAWRGAGALVREIVTLDALGPARALVLCNPNNPDGRISDPDRLAALARRFAEKDGLLVVDEAFADFAGPDPSLAPRLPLPGAILLRSFGKPFGLAGIRLGFALAEPRLASRIRETLGPWALSGAAIGIGGEALSDRDWQQKAKARLARDAARLDGILTRAGLGIVGGTSLFRLAASPRAPHWFERLARAGILVRAFAAHPDWLRFGMPGDEAAWGRLERVLS